MTARAGRDTAHPGPDSTARPNSRPLQLKGHADATATPQPKASGWHPLDWACEYVGTAGQLAVGFSVVAVLEAPDSPGRRAIGSDGLRLVLIGVAFGLLAAAVALSPIGRRSGAHLNPAVTFGFWLRRHTPTRDALGYAAAQILGALTAAAVFAVAWGAWAAHVNDARTVPANDLSPLATAGIETGLTCGLLLTVFLMLSSARTARWTPAMVTGVLAMLIWAGAPHTGASMNPARTLGPDIVASAYVALWSYVVGPLTGAAAAAGIFQLVSRRRTLTAKLFHDPRYPSVHATTLPATPHPSSRSQHRS
jgi:aquaporin Z